ncbi:MULTISPECIES: DUF6115 domain-containing protein [unclassified Helicobacter]|uniref:DUF6115 domain-containing protein n=1 Tax=unclassified Helicobacter TaxID=2593540 RepID=UPI000CF1A5E4|nr:MULTISPECIES: hypothetical protein [unclassified Helicobacter]
MDNNVVVSVVGLGCVVLVFLSFFFIKEMGKINRRIRLLEDAIEQARKEIHQFQKTMKEKEAFHQSVNMEGLNGFYKEIKEVREMVKSDRGYFEEKIIKLENRVKDFGHLGGSNDIDEKRIIALFQEGWSIDSIAKELRIGRGEVEFTLKLADI